MRRPFLAHLLVLRTTYRHSSHFGLSTSVFRLVPSACKLELELELKKLILGVALSLVCG